MDGKRRRPLPLKLLIVRQLYVWAVLYYQKVERALVLALINLESRLYEGSAPVANSPDSEAAEEDEDQWK